MKFTRENSAALMIRNVSPDGIQIGDELYGHTIVLTSDKLLDGWPSANIEDLTDKDFAPLLAENPEVVILGTGATNIFPPRELVFAMARLRVGFEVMDTGAAARTFNVLAGEGRQVAAVLYL